MADGVIYAGGNPKSVADVITVFPLWLSQPVAQCIVLGLWRLRVELYTYSFDLDCK